MKKNSTSPLWNGTADTSWYSESENEFTITTAEQLAGLAELVNNFKDEDKIKDGFKSKTIKLGTNIILNDLDSENWKAFHAWTPIGGNFVWITEKKYNCDWKMHTCFKGTFDGCGYTISGVYINSGVPNVGLFGSFDGTIKNLGVTASYVKGWHRVGGLVGIGGSINNSYYIGTVAGKAIVGGLAGESCDINNSYFIGEAKGHKYVGGLAGGNCDINNSYFIGEVEGQKCVGGLKGFGDYDNGNVINSYYDKTISCLNNAGKGEGKTTVEMKEKTTFANWDFDKIWNINEKINNGYPYLLENITENYSNIRDVTIEKISTLPIWNGTADTSWYNDSETEFTITTAEQLAGLAELVNTRDDEDERGCVCEGYNFEGMTIKLGANIILNDLNCGNWKNFNAWTPIGCGFVVDVDTGGMFNGTFDGCGYVISGVYINSGNNDGGLFESLHGTVKNLGVVNSCIKGDRVGGLVGFGWESTISSSYYSGIVKGKDGVGGLAASCHSTTINNSYFTGNVTGINNIGGLVGHKYSGYIINSYYDKTTSGQSDEGKGESKTTEEMKDKATFVGWDFDKVWGINDKINNGYPYLLKVD